MKFASVVLLCVAATVHGGTMEFTASDCGTNPNRAIRFNSFSVGTNPINYDQPLSVSFDIEVKKELTERTRVSIQLESSANPDGVMKPLDINSINQYWGLAQQAIRSPCEILTLLRGISGGHCPGVLTNAGFGCTCPVEPGRLTVPATTFSIPASSIQDLDAFADGNYRLKISFTTKKVEDGCIVLSSTLHTGRRVPDTWRWIG